ncbi:hypothetical protein BJ742DRAFT_712147 [Cladochytrium replicatum]|nr:hypothetical protein BJ742DRAFT_712147 [Cladochytrium replicatum]
MVYFFTSTAVEPPAVIYMGKDKFENEELIKYGFEEDIWFHVDKFSSAHVYLRIPPDADYTWENIPQALLDDCAQLTKANSIEGNKKDNITVIYTPWENLKKTQGMETGQVTFHKGNMVKKVFVEARINAIVNRLNKTRLEQYPDLAGEKLARQRQVRNEKKAEEKKKRKEEEERIAQLRKEKEENSYDRVMDEKYMRSNKAYLNDGSDDDFM